ncbi:IPT/TIG domain-containing protein [Flavobacterium sp. LM4]|uniref:IPT/TIG domain-containing protein n=1 Tax=Flavobacterium sp. LM4 TaxID=1938609 RepID=UPI000992A390|nr:IPT/TIG domain-containing protein [Flavobacterium sp. LM4]OOV17643.1 hypothetical protein BXU10_16400 [Flavobacterium sp. LM4]
MKNRILFVAVLQLFLTLNSCSSDSGNDTEPTPEPPVVVIKTAKITSYSKNSGETGETVSIYGENFSDKLSDIKITFDGVAATIVSASATEIKFTLPQTEKVLPKLELTIENRTVSNEVKNDYEGNIGILPTRSLTAWLVQQTPLNLGDGALYLQIINNKVMYLNGGKTLDGGITWKSWSNKVFSGFHVTTSGDGWSADVSSYGLWKVSAGVDATAPFESTKGNTYYTVFVEDNMQNGTIVSQKGLVLTTSNGNDFTKEYQVEAEQINLFNSTKIDNNHIWAIGYKSIKDVNGFTGNRPFILFKNNTTDGWKEYPFIKEANGYFAREICFVDSETGFLLVNHYYNTLLDVKLFKTTNGGDYWTQIYNAEKFTKFAFKDANRGWAILENKIYKTVDGGTTWTLDYTHDQPIKIIAYKDNVVWAISANKIIKRYL